jgi:cytochrome P450
MMSDLAPELEHDFRPEMLADAAVFGNETRLNKLFAWLLREHPVAWAEPEGYRPCWIITKYDDIREIERQPDIFLAAPRTILHPIAVEQASYRVRGEGNGGTSLVQLDGEKHRKLRNITQEWFAPKNVRKLEAKLKVQAGEFIDRMIATNGACDFAADVAFWFPLRVVMSIIGVPAEDEPYLLRLAHEMFAFQDPEFQREGVPMEELLTKIMMDYLAYFDVVTADRRQNPREDVATVIANAKVDGEYMDPMDRLSYYTIIASAGHDTTAASIGGAALALIRDPAEWKRLKANPDLCKPLADEAIRYTAPVKHFMRTATRDYEIRGQKIKAGQSMLLAFSAACRDPDIFPEPDRFIIDRKPNAHLAFGYGPHTCLGAHLARLEIELFYRALIERVESMELAGAPEFAESSFVSGLKRLPIRFVPV